MTYNELAELFKREGGDAQVCFSVISQNQILFGNNDTKKDIISFKNEEPIKWVKEAQEEPVSIWHDANQQPKMYRKYLVRYSDDRVSGSWERHDDDFIPWKDVVKEHRFTHWCYVEDLLKL
jgi:hypothetical protein